MVIGVALMFSGGPAGIVFGILFLLLGIATWIFTSFGATPWHHVSTPGQIVAGAGSIIGNAFLLMFFLTWFVLKWCFELFANS